MADEISKGDVNNRRSIFGIGSDADKDIIIFRFDPITKRLLVNVDTAGLENVAGDQINPATEDKQDDIKGVLDDVKTGTDKIIPTPATEAKQLADNHNVTVSNPTADPETGLATSAKQDTQETSLDAIQIAVEALSAPVTTALTLTTINTAYKMPASELANRRLLVIYNVSDTAVYIGSSAVTTTTGILLDAGGVMTIDSEKDLYAVCGTAGKIINLLEFL